MCLLRTRDVCRRLGGISRQTLWNLTHAGEFPPRRYMIGRPSISGWLESEVDEWIAKNLVATSAGDARDDDAPR